MLLDTGFTTRPAKINLESIVQYDRLKIADRCAKCEQ